MEDDSYSANPFQDPSIQAHTGAAPSPSAPAQSGSIDVTQSALAERKRELDSREAHLNRRESDLNDREMDLDKRAKPAKFVPNWPPFPEWMPFPFKPFTFHSIQRDIPEAAQPIMYNMFGLWYVHCFCYVVNFVAALAGLGCDDCGDMGQNTALAVLYMAIFIPVAFRMWYKPLYTGFKKDRAINFHVFFTVFIFQIIFDVYFAIGSSDTGGCGWSSAETVLDENVALGIFYIISAICWTACSVFSIYMLARVYNFYRRNGYKERAQNVA